MFVFIPFCSERKALVSISKVKTRSNVRGIHPILYKDKIKCVILQGTMIETLGAIY